MALKPLDKLPDSPLKIRRALLSVSDKTDITELAKTLASHNVELISTGGTAATLRDAGLQVKDVSDVTGFPECLDGRVKTLHPLVHGGILGRTSYEPDVDELKKLEITPFELVVVNLYPFKQVVSSPDITAEVATENIDIGGPTMVRAAAKNFAHVCILSSPDQYQRFLNEFDPTGDISFQARRQFALEAFQQTADYDAAISNWFSREVGDSLPGQLSISLPKSASLRYGENPQQPAARYGNQNSFIDSFHGKELSYNNLLDIDAALNLMGDLKDDDPAIAIFKHTVPCGVATDPVLVTAWQKAFATDKVSPFGGIVIANRQFDLATAEAVDSIFTEIILAPSFSADALKLLQQKKNRRLVTIKKYPGSQDEFQFRSIFGGALLQQFDREPVDQDSFTIVTKRKPTESELADMLFAWKVVKHVKSNAVLYAKSGQTLGIGTGQTSRVDSSEIAVAKAAKEGLSLKGCVVASDAFFPFADGIEAAAEAGATAAIQPGGSIRDNEVIAAADKHNMAMIFTGKRTFKH